MLFSNEEWRWHSFSFRNWHACGGYQVPPSSVETGYLLYSSKSFDRQRSSMSIFLLSLDIVIERISLSFDSMAIHHHNQQMYSEEPALTWVSSLINSEIFIFLKDSLLLSLYFWIQSTTLIAVWWLLWTNLDKVSLEEVSLKERPSKYKYRTYM